LFKTCKDEQIMIIRRHLVFVHFLKAWLVKNHTKRM